MLLVVVKGFVKEILTDSIIFIRDYIVVDIKTLFIYNVPKSFLVIDFIEYLIYSP